MRIRISKKTFWQLYCLPSIWGFDLPFSIFNLLVMVVETYCVSQYKSNKHTMNFMNVLLMISNFISFHAGIWLEGRMVRIYIIFVSTFLKWKKYISQRQNETKSSIKKSKNPDKFYTREQYFSYLPENKTCR